MKTESEALVLECENTLASALGLATGVLDVIRFDHQNLQQLFAVCLFARLVELATACQALLEKNALVALPMLVRSLFEADIDLRNIVTDKDYWKRMRASFLTQQLKLTKEAASANPNPFLQAIRETRTPQEDIERIENELAGLKRGGSGPICIRARAERAGHLDVYLTVYNMLCLDTHNNIRSLEDWHIEMKTTNDYHVVLCKKDKRDLMELLTLIPGILLIQCKAISDFLGIENIDFSPYFRELQAMQVRAKRSITG